MFTIKSITFFPQYESSINDFVSACRLWRIIIFLGWEDIRQRYVRTFLGPLWLIIGTSIWIAVMSFVMSSLFGNSLANTLPFIASGTILWAFIANILNDGCNIFTTSFGIIHSIQLPMMIHVLRFLVKNIIIFLHTLIVLAVIFILCDVHLNQDTLLVIPGFLLLIVNAFWISSLFSLINARFRDFQQIISSGMAVLPFVTPIYWEKSFLKSHAWIANINPFYHAIEIVRAPLLGNQADIFSWEFMLVIALLGIFFTLIFFSRYKHRIIHWI